MSFDLYADEVGKKVDALPLTTTIAPGIFDNFFTGTGQIAMQGFAKTARAASRLAAIPSIAVDKVMGGTTLQDSYFATSDPIFQGAVDFWTPKPNEVGVAAEVAGSLISQLPLMLGAPSLAVASAQMTGAEDVITAPGVTSGQALAVGAAQGIGLGIGIWAPPALGYNLASKAATGAGVNWLQGVLTRGASSAILGDNPVAKNYEPFGAKDQAIDVLLGLVFGAASQYVPGWKAEAEARTDQINVPAQRAIANEIGQTTAFDLGVAAARVNKGYADDRAERLKAWADSATPTQKAGLAVARLSHHMQIDSAPGRATSPVATNDHVTRLREAIDSLVRDGTVPLAPDVPRETIDQFTARAATDIAGTSELTSAVQLLQRAYIEQGPEAGRIMLDEMVAQLPEPDRPPGFADEVHQQLTERAQEWQEKQGPAFEPDPEREAFATQQTRAMQEAAARIARDEGLPEGPTILLPIRDQLKAHLTDTGFRQADGTLRKMTPAEADQYIADHAVLDEVNLRAMAAMTGGKMTPEQLLNRYLADVKMRTAVPEGALEQRMTPAQHIADFKPTVQTSQYGGTRYGNAYLELGNSVATNSKGQKGERRTFEIMDKSGGRAATVGFVIVEIDSKGKFAALRNIEIRKDVRTKGLGENVVATMVAHNGPGYTMDVVDITHGGKVGTNEDALPFWKKVGTQLKNYSRDPNVQMDGMLSLEDYLGARSGQGLGAGRGGSAAQAVPANRAGTGTAGSGVRRGGPSAADRAELARLNGDSLFQGQTWYYSALARAIDNVPTKAQPAKGWKDWLKGQIQKGAIKADEVKYTGLEEYLDLQPGKITKEQLQTFMQEGGVRVEEVELGPNAQARIDEAFAKAGYTIEQENGEAAFTDPNGDDVEFDLLPPQLRAVLERNGDASPKFTQWQLPGAKDGSYRELALVLPERTVQPTLPEGYSLQKMATDEYTLVGPDGSGQIITGSRGGTEAYANRHAIEMLRRKGVMPEAPSPYQVPSGHSMGPAADINRLAHIRFNERAGPNGERVLFIEEIQSDWAQQGKKAGFTEMAQGVFGGQVQAKPGTVPHGPFVGKTDAWVGLSLKRMIRYAAENGFDQIAWTTGAQQAERYDLSKQVDHIDYKKEGELYRLGVVGKNGEEVNLPKDSFTAAELEDVVGKEVAKKIVNGEGQSGGGRMTLRGLDLKVGGEGMKGFYDRIVPSVAKDVLKKLGGGKVEQTAIEIPGTAKELPRLEDIDEETWDALAGAEQWEGGQRPQIGETRLMVDGQIKPMTMVLDRNGVQFVSHDGDLVVMFDAGDVMNSPNRALWEKSPENARELLAEAWQKPARWEQLQVIIGDAKEAKPAEPEASKQQAITITPEMRDKAMESQALFQRAGHMSPHTFSRFDHSFMSKGEGAQVYGWGTYLFTKKEVGDWYYNNFQRKAEQEASITLVDQDRANALIADFSPKVQAALRDYVAAIEAGKTVQEANQKVADEHKGNFDDQDRMDYGEGRTMLNGEAVRTLTSRDDPAYKTPDGQVVHVSQTGPKRNLASAIGQVQHEGYARAALTFDNLITHAQAHLDSQKRINDRLRKEIREQLAADFEAVDERPSGWGSLEPNAKRYTIIQISAPKRPMAVVVENPYKPGTWSVRDPDTNYSLSGGNPLTKAQAESIAASWNSEPERTGRYEAGQEMGETPEQAIQRHKESLQKALAGYDDLDAKAQERVDETKHQRALVDEITTEPTPVPINVTGGPADEFSYLIPDNAGGIVVKISHSTPKASWEYVRLDGGGMAGPLRQGFQTKEEALAHAVGQTRTLKPGYETVKPTPKPVRKYTVEAPENDVLLNWEVSAGEQPQKVKDALANQGVLIPDESGILFNARMAREMDEDYINSSDMLTDDEKKVDIMALPNEDSSYYREKALEFMNDELADAGRLIIDPQASGRQVYVELMKMVGYDPARDGTRLDGKNTQYAAAASKMLAEAGIPGHRYYDGNSRSGRKRDQTYNFVIYDENAIDIVHMEQDQTRGYLNIGEDRQMTMGFLQSSDPSTPIHERAHFFLEMLDDLSREFPAAEAEMQVLFKEWSLDRATWDTMTLDDKRWYHEQFARSWEAYLMSNKAPTPELRSVFRRFRDWLVAIYESAVSLNVKVSTEMRELFDRLHGSQQIDPSTDPAAKAAASGPPPPPQPGVESQTPPGAVDLFADMPVEPKPFVPQTLDDQEMREHLRYMVDNEVGWAQVGGKNLTGQTGTVNFSTWIPRAEWWTQRPENIKKLKEGEYETAVAKALVGDKLKPIEQRAVDFMMQVANERLKAEQAIGKDEWNTIAKELVAAELEPTTRNVVDADAVAIANQIDEGMVERLAIQYDADDAGFMAEIRRMIDDQQNPEAPAGSQEAVGQAQEGVPAARPTAQPGPEAGPQAAGSGGVDLLAQEADRFVADNPTLTLEFEMPDGSTQKMTAAEYLADVRESAAMAREDIKLIHEAAQCLLGAS